MYGYTASVAVNGEHCVSLEWSKHRVNDTALLSIDFKVFSEHLVNAQ